MFTLGEVAPLRSIAESFLAKKSPLEQFRGTLPGKSCVDISQIDSTAGSGQARKLFKGARETMRVCPPGEDTFLTPKRSSHRYLCVGSASEPRESMQILHDLAILLRS